MPSLTALAASYTLHIAGKFPESGLTVRTNTHVIAKQLRDVVVRYASKTR